MPKANTGQGAREHRIGRDRELNPLALGASLGSIWGATLFLTTLLSSFTGYGRLFLETMAVSLYPGYTISPLGSVIGMLYGFADLFIVGSVTGWLYNKLARF
ncbi:MAG: bacteriophage holin [Alphaproteobacteria bacterium]|uniref:Bacteriophage holin n=1 Tax=Candidatus Nitrobium versatile TaxID=2884831 RepID=A0A953JDY2_9BACT|nr:bacteriophage holin [Candidatus Nitrobium versatile]